MSQRTLAVGTILLVGALHFPAVQGDWYFFLWWYDVMMHALGGMAMGFLGYALWSFLQENEVWTWKAVLTQMIFVVGFVALVGIGWEWFEWLVDAVVLPRLSMPSAQLGLTDTMLDLYFDVFGGCVAWLVVRVLQTKKSSAR